MFIKSDYERESVALHAKLDEAKAKVVDIQAAIDVNIRMLNNAPEKAPERSQVE